MPYEFFVSLRYLRARRKQVFVSIITFTLMHAVPGGPFDEEKQPLPPAAKANILRKYGLDRPIWEQYLRYMGSALRGDFGIPEIKSAHGFFGVLAQPRCRLAD